MPKHWTEEEQLHLLNEIPLYRKKITIPLHRQKIEQKELKVDKCVTLEIANNIHQKCPTVKNRTVNSIYERLPYLENLLAGVFEKQHYAMKDRHLYATVPREHGSREPNLCNTRHKYNGAMTEYLNKYN